jgi:hypothetical protein
MIPPLRFIAYIANMRFISPTGLLARGDYRRKKVFHPFPLFNERQSANISLRSQAVTYGAEKTTSFSRDSLVAK